MGRRSVGPKRPSECEAVDWLTKPTSNWELVRRCQRLQG